MVVATGSMWLLFRPSSTVPVDTYDTPLGTVAETAVLLLALGAVASVVGLVVRYRRGSQVVRRQIGWIALGGGAFVVLMLVTFALWGGVSSDDGTSLLWWVPPRADVHRLVLGGHHQVSPLTTSTWSSADR